MLDLAFIRQNLQLVAEKSRAKGVEFPADLFSDIDQERRGLVTRIEQFRSRKNLLAKEIGQLKREKKTADVQVEESVRISREMAVLEEKLVDVEARFQEILQNIPNIPDDSVPLGQDETRNRVVREWGTPPDFDFKPRPHWELGEKNDLLDLPRAAKITGARFSLSRNGLAKLERVLINYMLDVHTTSHGYEEILPPFIVNDASLYATGNLPKFRDDLFKLEGFEWYLVPTAEVPLTNIHRDESLSADHLPKSYVAYTPCFRSEAGSHGRDVRGIIRQHQFNKVELLKFTSPDRSDDELELLTGHAETILQELNLHYRVVLLCSGDTSFSAAKTYDLEVWMPGKGEFVEISSCSNFRDFQARRARIKWKGTKTKGYVHTLNGSGLAVGRTVAAVMENYQTKDGRIAIPEALRGHFPDRDIL